MSFLDFLSSGLTAGTQGAAGYLEGQQKGRKEEDERARQVIADLRQKRIDDDRRLMDQARLGNYKSMAEDRLRQKPTAALTHLPENSLIPDGKGGWKRAVPASTKGYEERSEGGGTAIYEDGRFKSWKIRPVQEREMSPAQIATQGQRQITNAMRMEQNFGNDENIVTAKKYASAFQGIKAAEKDSNPQTNLAMMYEAVKMRDPNAVREGELGLQLRARGVPQWLYGMWARAAKGNMLTDTERKQIVDWAREKVVEQARLVRPIQARYGAQLRGMKQESDSSFVARDPFAGIDLNERANKYRRP